MDLHAPPERGDGRQARDLDIQIADLVEHECRLMRNTTTALLAHPLRHLPPLVEEAGVDDPIRIAFVEHLDVQDRLPLDEVSDGDGALGRDRAEGTVREDAQGLLERGDDVLAGRRRAAVTEEVRCRRERRMGWPEFADVCLERRGRVFGVLARSPPLDERGDARQVLLVARDVGSADDEYAGSEHVAGGLGEVGVLLAAEGDEVDGDLPGRPHGPVGIPRLDGIDDEPDWVVSACTGITGQIEHDDLIAHLAGLVGGELQDLRFSGRDDVPTGGHKQVHGL